MIYSDPDSVVFCHISRLSLKTRQATTLRFIYFYLFLVIKLDIWQAVAFVGDVYISYLISSAVAVMKC